MHIIVCIEGTEYKRYDDLKLSNHISLTRKLTRDEVEAFRVDPDKFINEFEE